MNPFLNSVDIVKAVIRWKWHLLVVIVISLIGSIIFSGPSFIKPKFKSFGIVYPSNLIAYSTESSTEQMLQMLQSSDVRQQIIDGFHLMNHYEIDSVKNVHARSEAINMYNDNVIINKTEYESVQIEVWDTDPLTAAAMVDSIIVLGDRKIRSVQREKATEVLVIAQTQLERKKAEMDSMEAGIKNYNTKYGLLDYKIQAKEASRGYANSLASGRGLNEMKSMMKTLTESGEDFNSLTEHLWRTRGNYNDLKVLYDIAVRDATKFLSYSNVVTHPIVADKKSYPVRWLIVLISVAASFFVAFFVLLMFGSKELIKD
jgi:capsule polysaccharide export protein KpsE/RkpR